MKNRKFELKILVVIFLYVLSPNYGIANHKQEKPNIIFLLTDDQRDKSFSILDHPWVKTPNFDNLIKKGVRFSNTYIAEPTCAPSRAAIFTGMHERVNGVGFSSSYKLTESQWGQTYPALLRKNGYYTGFIGKFGVEAYTFKGKASEKFDFWRAHDGWARFFPKTAKNCISYRNSKENIITPIMGETMEYFLDSIPTDKPFCLSVSFSIPHGTQTRSMYPKNSEAAAMMIPANENPELKGHPYYDTLYRNIDIMIPDETATDPYQYIPKRIMDQSQGRATKSYIYDYNPVSCKEHHIRYYQQISGLDKVVGNLLASLKERGLDENTVIIFGSDHGLLMGEYGMGGKGLLYDLASKIPCFVYDPGLKPSLRGRVVEDLVSSLDITTTILDYAGIEAPPVMEGESLKPLIYNERKKWREEIFLENLYTGRDTPFSEGVREENWKYIRMYDGVLGYKEKDVDFSGRKPDFEQLFNLEEDPNEMNNLISEYKGTKLLAKMRKKCQKHSIEINIKRRDYLKTNNSQLTKK